MKKIFVVLLVSLVAVAAFGERGGASYGVIFLSTNQNYTTGVGSQNLSVTGIGLNANSLYGIPFGFLMDVTIGYVLAGSVDGAALDMSTYPVRIVMDMTMGVGYQFVFTPYLLLTVGVGPHVNAAFLFSEGASPIDPAFVAGAGAAAKLEYMLSRAFGFSLAVKGTYDFLAVKNGYGSVFNSGFVLGVALGVSFHM